MRPPSTQAPFNCPTNRARSNAFCRRAFSTEPFSAVFFFGVAALAPSGTVAAIAKAAKVWIRIDFFIVFYSAPRLLRRGVFSSSFSYANCAVE